MKKNYDFNIQNKLKENILFNSCRSGNLELVKYLIDEKKCYIFGKTDAKDTILFRACESGNLELVKYLIIEKKLNINQVNTTNQMILSLGIVLKNLELVDYLLSLGIFSIVLLFLYHYLKNNDTES